MILNSRHDYSVTLQTLGWLLILLTPLWLFLLSLLHDKTSFGPWLENIYPNLFVIMISIIVLAALILTISLIGAFMRKPTELTVRKYRLITNVVLIIICAFMLFVLNISSLIGYAFSGGADTRQTILALVSSLYVVAVGIVTQIRHLNDYL